MLNKLKLSTAICMSILLMFMLFIYAYYFSGLRVVSSQNKLSMMKYPIIVIESDDWGAARSFSNEEVYKNNYLLLPKYWMEKYSKLAGGTLESVYDLENLFNILMRHKGNDGVNPVFTANYVVASPDYDKIKGNGYRKFDHKVFPRYSGRWQRGELLNTINEGIKNGLWQPEYHGYLHMDPDRWLRILRSGDNNALKLFQVESYGGMNSNNSPEYNHKQTYETQEYIIDTGINMFRDIFKVNPNSSISPYGVWDSRTENILSKHGVKIIQGINLQGNYTIHDRLFGNVLRLFSVKDSYHNYKINSGDRNSRYDIIYLKRNVMFEPLELSVEDNVVGNAINSIFKSWKNNEPAIISSHRYNYVGFDNSMTKTNLNLLDKLLSEIESLNSKVIYLTDGELGQLYRYGYSIRYINDKHIIIRNLTEGKKKISISIKDNMQIKHISKYSTSSTADCIIDENKKYLNISEDTICKLSF